jgi:hypothetical protein
VFTDIRGRFFNEGEHEGNIALGYRHVGDYGWNPGFWIGYDRRRTEYDADFNQISFGVEALSPDWDVRLNGYAPLTDSELISSSASATEGELEVIGDRLLFVPGLSTLSSLYELAFWGVDVEIGYRIPLERWGLGAVRTVGLKDGPLSAGRYHDLRVYLGAYHFENTDFDEDIAGPRARAEWRIENILEDWNGSRLTLEAGWQHDDVRDNQFEGGLRLRIPLGGRSAGPAYALSAQEMRMTEGLKRDRDIVTETAFETSSIGGGPPEPVEDAVTGVDFDSITFVNNGDDLNAALTGAGGNALLVAFGGATNFGGTTMLANQTLLGGGGSLQVRSRTTGLLYTYNAPGTRPTLQGGDPGLTTANNSHINDVNINTPGSIAIVVGSGQRVFIDGVTITNASTGISATGTGSNLTVRNSTFSDGTAGILSGDENQALLIENNIFNNLGTGVVIGDASANVTSADFTVIGNTFTGAFTNYLLTFPNGTVNLMPGSTGNVDATSASLGICIRDFFTTLVGAVEFEGGATAEQTTCAIP